NHLDLDSKDVLLDALEDFGGTLIFVSHDRYFVDKLATKTIDVGHGTIEVYPGSYEQFLWSKEQRAQAPRPTPPPKPAQNYQEKREADVRARKEKRAAGEREKRVAELEARIAERENAIKELEAQMAAPGFYNERESAEKIVSRHHALMWEVGDLMNQWEALQSE